MIELTVDEKKYRVEFRHVTTLGKRRELYKHSPVKAVTTCVIVGDGFVAIDNAICSNLDNFSRREGRILALEKALRHCGALHDVQGKLLSAYLAVDPEPVPQSIRKVKLTISEKKAKFNLSDVQVRRLMEDAGVYLP